jgi:hypothetical protein
MKIQPSFERVNGNEVFDFEIDETRRRSETRLFRFFSPEKRTLGSAARATAQTRREYTIKARRFALMGSRSLLSRRFAKISDPGVEVERMGREAAAPQ